MKENEQIVLKLRFIKKKNLMPSKPVQNNEQFMV